ncbi:MAG: hypothetical protein HQL50_15990, partial [Magnetococcales bacterium]|nr:hypothetical protein [Magnetococcales bacterium]
QAGTKIGALGRSYTWENGGYGAHLHLGLHDGPYLQVPHIGRIMDLRFRGRMRRGVVVHADQNRTHLRIHEGYGTRIVHKATTWVTGYISHHAWESHDHGWLSPQPFLKRWCQQS